QERDRNKQRAAAAMAPSAVATAKPNALLAAPTRGGFCCRRRLMPKIPAAAARLRVSASASSSDVPDFLSANWLETRKRKPFGPRLNFSAEEAVEYQLESLKYNDQPHQDYGIEIMYATLIPLKGQVFLDDGLIWDSLDFSDFYFISHRTECCWVIKKEKY
ncbi:hypothetical protein EJB05_36449, partial [Eragrostis curvula]